MTETTQPTAPPAEQAETGGYRVAEHVVWLDGDDEIRLYDSSSGEFETLNATGAAIWRAVADGAALDDAAADLAVTYGAEDDAQRAAIRADLIQFVDDLARRGLLERDRGE